MIKPDYFLQLTGVCLALILSTNVSQQESTPLQPTVIYIKAYPSAVTKSGHLRQGDSIFSKQVSNSHLESTQRSHKPSKISGNHQVCVACRRKPPLRGRIDRILNARKTREPVSGRSPTKAVVCMDWTSRRTCERVVRPLKPRGASELCWRIHSR